MVLRNFIVFEGIDGAGTSTQLRRLGERDTDGRFFLTAEPTELPTGRFLRRMLRGEFRADARTAAHLFAADRAEHLYGAGGVLEQCAAGRTAVSDRYLFSSLAYQAVQLGMDLPLHINGLFPLPCALFFFNIPAETAVERIKGRGTTEIYEKLDYLQQTRRFYDEVLDMYSGERGEGMEIVRIDATLPADEVEKIIWSKLRNLPTIKA